jgi:hypothetical protein
MAFPYKTAGSLSQGAAAGLTEEGINIGSGLRTRPLSGSFSNQPNCITHDWRVAGGDGLGNFDEWTPIPEGNWTGSAFVSRGRNRLPMPCTPCITMRQAGAAAPGGHVFGLRIRGIGQFGEYLEEIIPNQTIASGTTGHTTRIWASKVFAVIEEVAFMGTGFTPTDDRFDVGVFWVFDLSYTTGFFPIANTQFRGLQGQGVGTGFRVLPYGRGSQAPVVYGPKHLIQHPEMMSLVARNLTSAQTVVLHPNASKGLGDGGFVIGQNEPGWQPYTHKWFILGFAPTVLIRLSDGTSSRFTNGAGAGSAQGFIGDEWLYFAVLRTARGTAKGSVAKSYYAK